ncbi:MAG: phenylalanine--tRNA ligase subunit alpha [Bacteroidales bacterium]|nr:MAG: phenylalanine--tRNA ligase subunit alpha [Bacteroidales bacterium]
MEDRIRKYLKEVESFSGNTLQEIEEFRIKFLSKKGLIAGFFSEFKTIPPDRRKQVGQLINQLKKTVTEKITVLTETLDSDTFIEPDLDPTLPAEPMILGSRHPVSIVRNEIIDIFGHLGFTISEGPEIEDDDHVFSKLNFPPNHPARDMQDTFFIRKGFDEHGNNIDILLRSHTSSVQVRVMEEELPPIRTLSPGRVFRNEAISARSHCIFHQVEGLYIDEYVSFADLKQTLLYFAKEMFGAKTNIRLRPSFFPFTEPSAEMDISCSCNGKGCNLCKFSGWLEILGCGMVDPNVLDYMKIDSKKYTGFAFGMGIERIALLKYRISDIRLLFENDIRFLKQFRSAL